LCRIDAGMPQQSIQLPLQAPEAGGPGCLREPDRQ
jgi:hypothetical protein